MRLNCACVGLSVRLSARFLSRSPGMAMHLRLSRELLRPAVLVRFRLVCAHVLYMRVL